MSYSNKCSCCHEPSPRNVDCHYKPHCKCGRQRRYDNYRHFEPCGVLSETYCWTPCDNSCPPLECHRKHSICRCSPCEPECPKQCHHNTVTKTVVHSECKSSPVRKCHCHYD